VSFRVTHTTRYDYGASASVNHNEVRLTPRTFPGQICTSHELRVTPESTEMTQHVDFFGNRVTYFSVQRPHSTMGVTAVSEVHLDPAARPVADDDLPWESVQQRLTEDPAARPFVLGSPMCAPSPALADYAAVSFPPGAPLLAGATELMSRIHTDYEYVPEYTTIATPLSQLLSDRRGVCQDFAHVAIGALRSLGLAARYVSGYLETLPPPGREKLRGADASHAWFSVLLPGAGWFDFDPTNDQRPGDQHITVAWGRDYSDVTPLKGVVFGSGMHDMAVSVDVERLDAPVARGDSSDP
jgi:transglutaminase-like putative cysteine protease